MVKTASTMLPLGTPAPDFHLTDVVSGKVISRSEYYGEPLLIMFICAHCPFVIHIEEELAKLGEDYGPTSLKILAICANDVKSHPGDAPEKLAEQARKAGFNFPYLHDKTQETAKAYTAACTPDFFLFDENHRLKYRGQLDSSRPGSGIPVTGADLRTAIDTMLSGHEITTEQQPSIGCNIKWTPGNEPGYFFK